MNRDPRYPERASRRYSQRPRSAREVRASQTRRYSRGPVQSTKAVTVKLTVLAVIVLGVILALGTWYRIPGDYLIRNTVGDPGQESASAAVSRAISALSHPWVSNGARTKLEAYAQAFFDANNVVAGGKHVLGSHERVERQRVLRALILAGPDGFLS